MGKSLIGAVVGATIGTVVGVVIGQMSFRLGDTSSATLIGQGLIAVFGFGFGAVAGSIAGLTNAILDVLVKESRR